MGRLFKQKVSEEIEALNNTLHQINIIDIYRAFLSKKMTDYTFFSSAHRTFSRTDNILGYKTSLNKFNKIEIIPVIFFKNRMKVEINYKKKKLEQPQIHGH